MRMPPIVSGKDPLDLVKQGDLVKALKKSTEIDGKVIREILFSNDLTYKEYCDCYGMGDPVLKTIKSLDDAKRKISSLLNNNPEICRVETGNMKFSPMLEDSEVKTLKKIRERLEKKRELFNNITVDLGSNVFVNKEDHKKVIQVEKLYDYIKPLTTSISHPYSEIAIYGLISDLISLEGVSLRQYKSKQVKKIHENHLERRKEFPTKAPYHKIKNQSKK